MDTENQNFITEVEDILEPEKKKSREQEQKEAQIRAKKRKLIPPFVMLSAGAIVSITMFALHYKFNNMLVILLCVLVAFYIAGGLLKWMLDHFEAQIEEARMEEGEVIEKEPDEGAEHGSHEEIPAQAENANEDGDE